MMNRVMLQQEQSHMCELAAKPIQHTSSRRKDVNALALGETRSFVPQTLLRKEYIPLLVNLQSCKLSIAYRDVDALSLREISFFVPQTLIRKKYTPLLTDLQSYEFTIN